MTRGEKKLHESDRSIIILERDPVTGDWALSGSSDLSESDIVDVLASYLESVIDGDEVSEAKPYLN